MYGHNPGHITRGDPVMRTRRLLQKDIEALEAELNIIEDDWEHEAVRMEIEELRSSLAAVMELEGV